MRDQREGDERDYRNSGDAILISQLKLSSLTAPPISYGVPGTPYLSFACRHRQE